MAKRFLTLEAAIDLLFSLPDDEREGASICQLPPDEDGNITDEEHVNDNDFSEVVPDDVCGQVEVMQCSDEDFHSSSRSSSPEPRRKQPELRQLTAAKGRKASTKAGKAKRPKHSHTPAWGDHATFDKTLPSDRPPLLLEAFPELANMSPFMLFSKIISPEYLASLAELTARYALQKGEEVDVTGADIGQFFGLLLFSGYHSVPSEGSYWSTAEDLCLPIVATVMARNRFRQLKRFFHVVDNTQLQAGKKMGKIQPFYDEISKCFRQFGVFHESLSIDESMVPYYGHHSCKMFIRGKPIRFGYKIWMMCSSNGYPYAMEIYCGRNEKDDKTPLGIRVVSNMISVLQAPEQHEVYFDNFFTSHGLLTKLADQGIRATGTVRDSRTGGCPLKSVKDVGKEERGSFHYKCDGAVYTCRWNDNAVVTVSSNHLSHEPVGSAKRFSRRSNKKVEIPQPHLIKKYNEGMGGVDVMDRLLGSYRPRLRSKKWWWNLFSNGLNMALIAGWLLHCELHKGTDAAMTHIAFRRDVTMSLLQLKQKLAVRPGPRVHPRREDRKTDGHYIVSATQGRCAECKKNTTNQCQECKKRLHKKCFAAYHGL